MTIIHSVFNSGSIPRLLAQEILPHLVRKKLSIGFLGILTEYFSEISYQMVIRQSFLTLDPLLVKEILDRLVRNKLSSGLLKIWTEIFWRELLSDDHSPLFSQLRILSTVLEFREFAVCWPERETQKRNSENLDRMMWRNLLPNKQSTISHSTKNPSSSFEFRKFSLIGPKRNWGEEFWKLGHNPLQRYWINGHQSRRNRTVLSTLDLNQQRHDDEEIKR